MIEGKIKIEEIHFQFYPRSTKRDAYYSYPLGTLLSILSKINWRRHCWHWITEHRTFNSIQDQLTGGDWFTADVKFTFNSIQDQHYRAYVLDRGPQHIRAFNSIQDQRRTWSTALACSPPSFQFYPRSTSVRSTTTAWMTSIYFQFYPRSTESR